MRICEWSVTGLSARCDADGRRHRMRPWFFGIASRTGDVRETRALAGKQAPHLVHVDDVRVRAAEPQVQDLALRALDGGRGARDQLRAVPAITALVSPARRLSCRHARKVQVTCSPAQPLPDHGVQR
jgi:hypothetical protein